MEIKIKELLATVGEGIINPVPYDTAIVAGIPQLDCPSEPQFPECLEWLRSHQLSDGSWGTDKPTYAYGNVLCTLAAIIALKKWDKKEKDYKRIRRGETALKDLVKRIPEEKYESIGYEILLPMLLIEAKQLCLKVPFNELDIRPLFEEKINSIKEHQQRYGWHRKHTFWFSLEMIAGLTKPTDRQLFALNDKLLETNGSVCGSPSATAFYMMTVRAQTKKDLPSAHSYIANLVKANSGGVPPLSPSDTFELSFSLSALLMADFPPEHQILKPSIDKLLSKWNQFNGFIGCSSYLPPDIDAISAFIYVLNSSNRFNNNSNSLQKMLKFFNGKYFMCFKGERNASISVNINALIALKSYQNDSQIQHLISNVVDWLKRQISSNGLSFEDKWHISPYYSISRAVFAFQSIDDRLAQTCVTRLLSHQNLDFGWGLAESTLEETAFVSLSLCYWFTTNANHMNVKKVLKILKSIQKFFKLFDGKEDVELWIAKSLYCPILVVNVFIISAKYSLNKTIDFLENK